MNNKGADQTARIAGLHLCCSQTPNDRFLVPWPIFLLIWLNCMDENNMDLDQLAFSKASLSGSSLFFKSGYSTSSKIQTLIIIFLNTRLFEINLGLTEFRE